MYVASASLAAVAISQVDRLRQLVARVLTRPREVTACDISVFKDVPVTRNQDCVGLPCPEVVDPAKDGSEFPTKIQQPLASAAEAVRQPARVRHDCLVNLGEVVRADRHKHHIGRSHIGFRTGRGVKVGQDGVACLATPAIIRQLNGDAVSRLEAGRIELWKGSTITPGSRGDGIT